MIFILGNTSLFVFPLFTIIILEHCLFFVNILCASCVNVRLLSLYGSETGLNIRQIPF